MQRETIECFLYFLTNKKEKTMKRLFASLVMAIAVMCFAPTAGATESATSSPQTLKYEAVVNQQYLSKAERA